MLVVMDDSTRYAQAYATKNKAAHTVAKSYTTSLFYVSGTQCDSTTTRERNSKTNC